MRTLGEQVNIVQLKIGMALIPVLSQAASALSDWLSTGGTDQIVGFFKNAAKFAAQFGEVMRDWVIPAFGLIKSGWDALPGPLKDLLIGGVVANKLGGFLFDKSLFSGLKNIGGGLLGQVTGRGGTPANPVFVQQVGGLPGGPGAPTGLLGAGAGFGEAAGVASLGTIATLAAPFIALAILPAIINNLPQSRRNVFDANGNEIPGTGNVLGIDPNVKGPKGGGGGPAVPVGGFAAQDAAQQNALAGNAARLFNIPQLAGWTSATAANTSALEANTKELYDTSAAAHAAAKAALGGSEAAIHKFILELRSGNTSVAIKDFPRELAYLQSVDDKMKMTPGFHRTLVENIANLKRDMVGATASQKAKLSADIKALQALDASRLGAINATLNKIAGLVVQYGGFGSAGAQASHAHPGHNHGAVVTARSVTVGTTGSRRSGPTRVGNIGASGYSAGGV